MAVCIETVNQRAKLNNLLAHYRGGDFKEAARRIRALSKREVVKLLCANHQLSNGFRGDGHGAYELECFVDRALDGWNE